jgi:hypothetical protein
MIVVVDASVAVQWFLPQRFSMEAKGLLLSSHELVAPEVMPLEVGSALLRAVRRHELAADRARHIVESLLPGAIRIVVGARGTRHPFDIAERFGGTIYDAVYIALADSLNAPLATSDVELAQTAARIGVRVATGATGFVPPP